MLDSSNPVRTRDAGPDRGEVSWRRHAVPRAKPGGFMTAARPDLVPAMARADWLEKALSDLPVVDSNGTWQSAVHQRHALRQAEFALAASLRSVQMGQATITMSETAGTSIRMYGIRATSLCGFGTACRLWIEAVRQQASADD